MKKQSAEDYLDKLLNSVNGEETMEEEEMTSMDIQEILPESQEEIPESVTTKNSRRVTKSEEDFLREFEAELEGEDFEDFLKDFDKETGDIDSVEVSFDGEDFSFETRKSEEIGMPEEKWILAEPEMPEEIRVENKTENRIEDSFELGGVDLGALLNETTETSAALEPEVMLEEEFLPKDLFGVDFGEDSDFPGAAALSMETGMSMDSPASQEENTSGKEELSLEDLFSMEDAFGELEGVANNGTEAQPAAMQDDMFANLFGGDDSGSDSIDLGNLGEADLMSLLAGEDGLSDLGDMLSGDGASLGGGDVFSSFAEGEMSSQGASQESSEDKKPKKGKGIFAKIKEFLLSDDDDEELELKTAKGPSAGQLSGENADILAQIDAEEKGKKGKGGFLSKLKKDKDGKDKEKKTKKEKVKKEKPPKEKKPKKEKPKKEKKPKEVDNTPPLPKAPVMMIWIMAFSMLALVYLGTNLASYSAQVSSATTYYNTGNYAEAYRELAGLTISEKDMALYNQVATLATVDSELNAYKIFSANFKHVEALDSLVCAAGRCELNEDNAEVYECLGQLEVLKHEVSNELYLYSMTYEEALSMYHMKDREDYTVALYTKIKELGLN